MKRDIKSNYAITEGLAAVSRSAGAHNSASVDMSDGASAAFFLTLGNNGTAGTVDAKLQHSADNSTGWTDEVSGAGNDTAITQLTTEGVATLHVINPRRRYYRAVVTIGTEACVLSVTNIVGPLHSVAAA